jgi:hypothetical protein
MLTGIEEAQQPAQASASLLLRVEAIVIAGTAASATPDEPQRAVRKTLSFDRRSTASLRLRQIGHPSVSVAVLSIPTQMSASSQLMSVDRPTPMSVRRQGRRPRHQRASLTLSFDRGSTAASSPRDRCTDMSEGPRIDRRLAGRAWHPVHRGAIPHLRCRKRTEAPDDLALY